MQGTAQEKEESDADLAATQSPGVQEWLAQARTAWTQQRQSSLQQQKVTHFLTFSPADRPDKHLERNVLEGQCFRSSFCTKDRMPLYLLFGQKQDLAVSFPCTYL